MEGRDFISALGTFMAMRGKCTEADAQRRHWRWDTGQLLTEAEWLTSVIILPWRLGFTS